MPFSLNTNPKNSTLGMQFCAISLHFGLFYVTPHSKNRFKTLSSASCIVSKEIAKSITSSAIAKPFGVFPRISFNFFCNISDAAFVPKF